MLLTGKSAICNFMGKGWPVIEKLIQQEGFPARRVAGVLQADSEEITAWRRGRPPRVAGAPASAAFQFREGYDGSSTTGIIQGEGAGAPSQGERHTIQPAHDTLAGLRPMATPRVQQPEPEKVPEREKPERKSTRSSKKAPPGTGEVEPFPGRDQGELGGKGD